MTIGLFLSAYEKNIIVHKVNCNDKTDDLENNAISYYPHEETDSEKNNDEQLSFKIE